ncbi:MAG: dTMP kinase [Gemmatimonadetes bacterium]|nr:dTMP kinase [Gemmatimonadota bacterium]
MSSASASRFEQRVKQSPLFIVFEGIDGSGTTTQSKRLFERLQEDGHDVVLTREPGGTPLAERIRDLVLDPDAGDVDHRTELLLYGASRRQHVAELIAPSLASGKPVISDRYAASTVAYQGIGRGLGVDLANAVNDIAVADTTPDLTICLDVPVDVSLQRRHRRGGRQDRLEKAGSSLQQAVRQAFLDMSIASQDWFLIDAVTTADAIHDQIWSHLHERFAAFPFRK